MVSITKKYNIFNFFTTLAKSLVEVFIPIILYNRGLEIKSIFLFLMISFALSIFFSSIITKIGERVGFKWMVLISSIIFAALYFYLSKYHNIFVLSLFYSLNNMLYYVSKHNYAVTVVDKKQLGAGVGSFLIVSILATIPASLLGSFLIEKLSIITSTIIILVVYLIGVIPLFYIKYENHHHDTFINMVKKIPLKNYFFFGLTQIKSVFFLFYPLYIYINLKSNYSFIGVINMITGLASIIFIYYFARIMDKHKKDHMLFASILLGLILLAEINTKHSSILLILSFFEGIATKIYETSSTRDFYLIDAKTDKACYFLVSEVLNNSVKFLLIGIAFIFNAPLYTMLVVLIIGMLLSGFVKFVEPKKSK